MLASSVGVLYPSPVLQPLYQCDREHLCYIVIQAVTRCGACRESPACIRQGEERQEGQEMGKGKTEWHESAYEVAAIFQGCEEPVIHTESLVRPAPSDVQS